MLLRVRIVMIKRLGGLLLAIIMLLTFSVLATRSMYFVACSGKFEKVNTASEVMLPERTAVFVPTILLTLFVAWSFITGDSENVPTELPDVFSSLIASLFLSAPLLGAVVVGPHKFWEAMSDVVPSLSTRESSRGRTKSSPFRRQTGQSEFFFGMGSETQF